MVELSELSYYRYCRITMMCPAMAYSFSLIDYIIFVAMVMVSGVIGVYYRFSGGRQTTSKEFLVANHSMGPVPVSFSLMASFMSAVTLLGVSQEMYRHGTLFILINIGYCIGTPLAAHIFLPVFYSIRATSAFQYLELRFDRRVRLLASFIFMLQTILYMSIVLYAPALALSAVTTLSKWASILALGVVCTFYCSLGGIKAVLWTDVFQSLLMFASIISIIIIGANNVGGLGQVWAIAKEGGRIEFDNWDPDPTVRHTVWSLVLGGTIVYVSVYGTNQTQVQRYMTVKSLTKAKLSMYYTLPLSSAISLTTAIAGLVVYANLHSCDPLLTSSVQTSDQLLPYFVMKMSKEQVPGLAGLFVAGLYSAALSSLSSAIHSLAAVTLEDFIQPALAHSRFTLPCTAATLAKLLAVGYGILCLSLTVLVERLGSLLQAGLTVLGVVGGPLLGLFTLGMLCPGASSNGALVGLLCSLGVSLWTGFGARFTMPPPPTLPLSADGCPPNTTILPIPPVVRYVHSPTCACLCREDVFGLYRISYMWYATLGFLITLVVGVVVSYLT
ncbi:hypothetical protein LAZ67_14000717, partial [Cordylochernes scorpioides]